MKARDEHLAGATVLRGPMGFGAASRIHTAKILRLSMNEFLPDLERMIGGGLVTLEKIKVIHYRHKKPVEPDVERLSYALPDVPASFSF